MSSFAPVISVCTAVYNGERYLAQAVESILAQSFGDFEYILIDDGSTDGSLEILRGFEKRDRRVRLVSRENKGLTKSLNEAIRLSRGEFIARMDGDDVARPNRFELQHRFLREHPDIVCCGGAHELIDGKGRLLTTLALPTSDEEIQQKLLAGHTAICHPCAMFRKSAAEQVSGYDEQFRVAQDLDMWLRLGEVGKLANLPEVLLQFRMHESSVSETSRQRQRDAGKLACELAWKRRGITNGAFEASEQWRPGKDRLSQHLFALRYGWWAFNAAQRRTAMYYGAKAVLNQPHKSEGWRLLLAAAIKRMPQVA